MLALRLEGDDQSDLKGIETFELAARPGFMEWTPSFSRDGRWVAYASDETGQMQVYVQAFPEGTGRKRISELDLPSNFPVWSKNSNELLFNSRTAMGQSQIYTTQYEIVDGSFKHHSPVPWNGAIRDGQGNGPDSGFDIDPEGKRLLVKKWLNQEVIPTRDHIILIENFFDVLREKAPANH
ncbi:MAG: hypothetical protein HOH33_09160 [Verrucomicrobia bacterium]|nr:hypothetical protein [Verrucomicrobiota bacterium]